MKQKIILPELTINLNADDTIHSFQMKVLRKMDDGTWKMIELPLEVGTYITAQREEVNGER